MAVEWTRFFTGGTEWTVRIGSIAEFPDLESREGYTDPDTCEIHIWEQLTPSRRVVVLFHEMMHAVISAPGDEPLFARVVGCAEEDSAGAEEAVITHIAPKLVDALQRLGMLRPPRVRAVRKSRANKAEKVTS